jgi:hypothetical protein
MDFELSYELREHCRTARRWLEEHWRITALGTLAALVFIVYMTAFVSPFESREMVILYRPSPDGSSVVFNLGDEYRVRTVRLIALDEEGREGETVWRYKVPSDTPRLSTFSVPPQGRAAQADDPPPPIEPGKTYRLRVSAAGASGVTDFSLTPSARRQPG